MIDFRMLGVNDVYVRGIYPTAAGPTLGMAGGSLTPYDGDPTGMMFSAPIQADGSVTMGGATQADGAPATGGIIGQPLSWWFVLVLLLVGLMYGAKKLGAGEEFKNLKLSVYNVVVISIASVVGIGFFKVLFNKFKVPGLTGFVNAV
jgi:hypothetical protein